MRQLTSILLPLVSFFQFVMSFDGLSFQDAVIETIASNEAACGSYGSPDWELLPIEDCSGVPCDYPDGICRYNFIDDIFNCFPITNRCQKVLQLAHLLDQESITGGDYDNNKSPSPPRNVVTTPVPPKTVPLQFPTRIRPIRVKHENPTPKPTVHRLSGNIVTTPRPLFRLPIDTTLKATPTPFVQKNRKIFTDSSKKIRIIRLPSVESDEIMSALDQESTEWSAHKNSWNTEENSINKDSAIDDILGYSEESNSRQSKVNKILGEREPPSNIQQRRSSTRTFAPPPDRIIQPEHTPRPPINQFLPPRSSQEVNNQFNNQNRFKEVWSKFDNKQSTVPRPQKPKPVIHTLHNMHGHLAATSNNNNNGRTPKKINALRRVEKPKIKLVSTVRNGAILNSRNRQRSQVTQRPRKFRQRTSKVRQNDFGNNSNHVLSLEKGSRNGFRNVGNLTLEIKDYHKFCCYWAQQGHCYSNGRFTRSVCQKSCGTPDCTEKDWRSCTPNIPRECRPRDVLPQKNNPSPSTKVPLSRSTKVKLRLLSVQQIPLDELKDLTSRRIIR